MTNLLALWIGHNSDAGNDNRTLMCTRISQQPTCSSRWKQKHFYLMSILKSGHLTHPSWPRLKTSQRRVQTERRLQYRDLSVRTNHMTHTAAHQDNSTFSLQQHLDIKCRLLVKFMISHWTIRYFLTTWATVYQQSKNSKTLLCIWL